MQGRVQTQFSNPTYMAKQCATPIRNDEVVSGTTCLQIEHAAQGYHNYQRYINFWSDIRRWGNGTKDIKLRPQGFGLLHENTSITADWINSVDVAKTTNENEGRIINNVSLAMPHAGIFQAAREPRNGILQPEVSFGTSHGYTKRRCVSQQAGSQWPRRLFHQGICSQSGTACALCKHERNRFGTYNMGEVERG